MGGDLRALMCDRILSRQRITDEDVRALITVLLPDGIVDRDDAVPLFEINRVEAPPPDAWSHLFSELLIEFVNRQSGPDRIISPDTAEWLVNGLSLDGRIRTWHELDALLRMVEMARECPPVLPLFALRQARDAVVNGYGAARGGRPGLVATITGADIELVRRILMAPEDGRTMPVTRAEAEILFDMNDRTRETENHPSWVDLFVKAVSHYLLASCGYAVPHRRLMLGDTAPAILSGDPRGALDRLLAAGVNAATNAADLDVAFADTEETRWLSNRIARDGEMRDNERILLFVLRHGGVTLPASLQTLVDTAA
ncbi:MAG: hypothetical protein KDJ77_13020 [Rhodobiaceae bacterium]|nr:hypothetical protein [Rhodobiaceae bacterium]